MGKITRLLDRPLKAFTLYALIILILSIPVYALVVDFIWTNELDENNWLTLQHTKQKLQSRAFNEEEVQHINRIWSELQPGLSIKKSKNPIAFEDSTYEVVRTNIFDEDDGEDRFRGLKSFVKINEEPYVLTIETNVEESDETIAAIAFITFIFFIILIVGFILLNRKIAMNSWKPFYQTLKRLNSFELSKDGDILLPDTDILEFQELNKSLHKLIKNNVDAYQQQKQFIENASHELQTPIALFKSKLDLLIQQQGLSPEITEILSSIEAPVSRLSRINKNLLVLAEVENKEYSEIKQIDLNEFIQLAISLFEDHLVERNLDLKVNTEESISVTANEFLIETLIQNLISNAIRHTSIGGEIRVIGSKNKLEVFNSGTIGLDKSQLFERFTNVAKNKVSSGLGLAIIREIANKYNWIVQYQFVEGYHVFSVEF